MAKKKKRVEYKETLVFELFPVLEYTKFQKKRLILFHAYARNIKRIINYAANFDKPNCFCMVYIVGDVAPEKVQKLLAAAECSNRVCVLTSPFPADGIDLFKRFDEVRNRLKGIGCFDDLHQDVNDLWWKTHKGLLLFKAQDDSDIPDIEGQIGIDGYGFVKDSMRKQTNRELQRDAEMLEVIRRYHALERKAPSYFRRWTLHRRDCKPKPFRHVDTGRLIAKIYPYGAEARGVNAYAGLSPASVEPAVKLITDGLENRRLGFSRAFVTNFNPARKIRKFVEDAFAAQGYCTFPALADFIKSPPFGLSDNGYSAAMLCAALYDMPDVLYFDGVTDSLLRDEILYFCRKILPPVKETPLFHDLHQKSCLYREYPCHKVVRDTLTELYEVSDYIGRYIVTYSRIEIERLFRLPLSMTDNLLYRLTGPEICWQDRGQMERLAAEVVARRDELPCVLAAHIARDKRIPQKQRIPSAACWLWDAETLFSGPYCMLLPDEQARLEEYWRQQAERRSNSISLKCYDDYLKDRLEPCKRRLRALCGGNRSSAHGVTQKSRRKTLSESTGNC